jgi:hypothetical protein
MMEQRKLSRRAHGDDRPSEGAEDRLPATTNTMDEQQQQPHRRHQPSSINGRLARRSHSGKSQLSSFILFAGLIILINLCPFQTDPADESARTAVDLQPELAGPGSAAHLAAQPSQNYAHLYMNYLQASVDFVRLMFSQPPLRLNKRVTRFTQAEARVLGKMAKVWYIKKKIKKLSKKLKKHTIAVPVFTAIPIYEHSY